MRHDRRPECLLRHRGAGRLPRLQERLGRLLGTHLGGTWQGKAVLYDRGNTQDLSLQGNGATSITGAVYLRSGTLDFNGNSCFGFSGGPVVANGVTKANGNKSCVTVTSSTDAVIAGVPGEVALSE